ncbi:hypothetical protein ACHAW5_006846 [Stephanodiscus triporus]|uniref:Uncharacterized protein n=1 Tax=Stephanodiscus triporus TaxID=2934178 RepID=A0ABD3PXQ5_9STRA
MTMPPMISSRSEQFAGLSTAENSRSGNATGDVKEFFDVTSKTALEENCVSSTVTVRTAVDAPSPPSTSVLMKMPDFKRGRSATVKSNSNKLTSIAGRHVHVRSASSTAGLGSSISKSAPTILIHAPPDPLLSVPIRSAMTARTLEESLHRQRQSPVGGRGRKISFVEVKIREYERVLGDNPSVTSGPPLSIGWRHSPTPLIMSLDDYESGKGSPRSSSEYLVPKLVREAMLREHADVTRRDMVNAVRSVQKEKAQRRKTVVNLGMAATEERIEGVRRKMSTILKRSSSYSCLEAKLWDEAHARAAEKARTLEESIRGGESVTPRDLWSVGTPCDMILPSRRNIIQTVAKESPPAASSSSSSSSSSSATVTIDPPRLRGNDSRRQFSKPKSKPDTTDNPTSSSMRTDELDSPKSKSALVVEETERRLSSSIVAVEPSDSETEEILMRLLLDDSGAN